MQNLLPSHAKMVHKNVLLITHIPVIDKSTKKNTDLPHSDS